MTQKRRTVTLKIPTLLPSGNTESVQIRPFWKAYTDIFETTLSAYEKIILTAVASWPEGKCRYSEKKLAQYASCSTKTIQRSIKSLAHQGLLIVTPVDGTTSIYRVRPWTQSPDPTEVPWTESPTPLDTESTLPWTHSPDTLDTESTYNINNKINDKIINKISVADAPITPTLAESATPSPSSKPEPKTKAKKKPFPDEAYWSDAFPGILEWMKSKGFDGSDTAAKTWFDQCVERMRDACEANPTKYRYENWSAAFRNWNRDRLFKESSSDAWIVAVFQYFWNETRTPVEKPTVTDSQRAAVNHALKKLGDSWRGGLSEATERDRPFRLKEFRDQLQETK